MPIGATKAHNDAVQTDAAPRESPPRRKQRRSALLVTADDALWPQVGAVISGDVVLRQIDSIDQLLATIEPGNPGVVIWDARGIDDYAAQLARIQQQSARIAVIALDVPSMQAQWTRLTETNQVVSAISVPLDAKSFNEALTRAEDEVQTRIALLGSHDEQAATQPPSKGSRLPLMIGAGILALAAAAALGVYEFNRPPQAVGSATSASAPAAALVASAAHHDGGDESVDALLEKAAQAMLDRRYIEPADNSALGYYRGVLAHDANNAEAKQGLIRLAELLLSRAQTALDQQHFEPALQALEIARDINHDDPRVQALDARLSKMRAELGSSMIQAAIDAGNYDHAAALIDEAASAQALTPPQLAQLREELRHRRTDFDADRFLKTAQARVQQDHLIDPAGDSAAHYFALAKKAGPPSPALAESLHDFGQRLMQAASTAIDQHRLGDADRLLSEALSYEVAPAAIADLRSQLAGARNKLAAEKREQQRLADLVKSRLVQGSLLEPAQDSAVYYLNSLKAADSKNEALPELSRSVQERILANASSSLDQGRIADAQAALQVALSLGASPDANALAAKISQATQAANGAGAPLTLLKPIAPKYPVKAATQGTEGWVEMVFTVKPDGRTSGIRVTGASPHDVFDHAAMDAVAAARYEPIPKDQPQVTRDAKLRLTFKLDK